MDANGALASAQIERTSACERKAEGKLYEALTHFRRAATLYESVGALADEQRREYAAMLYDSSETSRLIGNAEEASQTLRQAWLNSGTAMGSRGRETALNILKTEFSSQPFGLTAQPLRTTAAYILGGLDIGRPTNMYSFDKKLLSNNISLEGAKSHRSISTWGIIQLILFAIFLIFRLASCQ